MLDRRGFLRGLIAAPVVIRTPGLLMPVKRMPVYIGTLKQREAELRAAYIAAHFTDNPAFEATGRILAQMLHAEMQRPSLMRMLLARDAIRLARDAI